MQGGGVLVDFQCLQRPEVFWDQLVLSQVVMLPTCDLKTQVIVKMIGVRMP